MNTPELESTVSAEPACPLEQWPSEHAYLINAFVATLVCNTDMTLEEVAILCVTFLRGHLSATADPAILAQCKTMFEEYGDIYGYIGRVLGGHDALRKMEALMQAGAESEALH